MINFSTRRHLGFQLHCHAPTLNIVRSNRMELRSRSIKESAVNNQEPAARSTKSKLPPPAKRFHMQWDLLFWMLAAFTTLYLSEFASNLLLNDNVRRLWLAASICLLCTAVGCLVYAFKYHSRLKAENWTTEAPVLVPVATATSIAGSVCLTIAVWPVWRFWTFLILPILFMGFISTVSLFNL